MATNTILSIESSVNGYKQKVSPEELEVLKANGWKGRIVSEKQEEAPKSAKTPDEVKDSKK